MVLTSDAANGSPVARASWPFAAACSAIPRPAISASDSSSGWRSPRAPNAVIAVAPTASSTPATRGSVIGRRPAGPSPAASTGRLPPVVPHTSATVSSATPTSGATTAPTSTAAAPARPPRNHHGGGRPSARSRAAARGSAPVASTTEPVATSATTLLIAAATYGESMSRPSRPLT